MNIEIFFTFPPRLSILIEDGCGVTGFKLLAEISPVEDFLYPIPDDYKKGAEEIKSRYRQK